MAKARPPFDQAHYAALRAQGLSLRATAKAMGLADATLRETLIHLGLHTPMTRTAGTPQAPRSTPRRVRTPGAPQGALQAPQYAGGASLEHPTGTPREGGQEYPETPRQASRVNSEASRGTSEVPPGFSVAQWQDLQALLAWWRGRAPQGTPQGTHSGGKRGRATYHLDQRLIAAVQAEAQREGVLIAEVVERALRQYFAGKSAY